MLALLPAARSFVAETLQDIRDLKAGEFTWHPERQKKGRSPLSRDEASFAKRQIALDDRRVPLSTC